MLLDKYFSVVTREKFGAYSSFAPELVPNEERKIQMFTMALRNAIRRVLPVSRGVTLGVVMEADKRTEFYDETEAERRKSVVS